MRVDREAVLAHDAAVDDDLALAVLAQAPRQALGDDAVHGAGDEERLDAHLDQARDRLGGWCAVCRGRGGR